MLSQTSGPTKVREPEITVAVDENIIWLDIAVYNALRVQSCDSLDDDQDFLSTRRAGLWMRGGEQVTGWNERFSCLGPRLFTIFLFKKYSESSHGYGCMCTYVHGNQVQAYSNCSDLLMACTIMAMFYTRHDEYEE